MQILLFIIKFTTLHNIYVYTASQWYICISISIHIFTAITRSINIWQRVQRNYTKYHRGRHYVHSNHTKMANYLHVDWIVWLGYELKINNHGIVIYYNLQRIYFTCNDMSAWVDAASNHCTLLTKWKMRALWQIKNPLVLIYCEPDIV